MTRRRRMPLALKRKLYFVAGLVFLILGVLGLFLPILQGVLFLFVAVVLLSKSSARMRLLRRRFKHRYPKWGGKLDEAERWLRRLPRRFKTWLGRRIKPKRQRG